MRFAAVIAQTNSLYEALDHIKDSLRTQLGDKNPDLMTIFLANFFAPSAYEIIRQLHETFAPRVIIGCSAEGVIGSDIEVERKPAISVVAASLPGVVLKPFLLNGPTLQDETLDNPEKFKKHIQAEDDTQLFIVLGDPYTTPIEPILNCFNAGFPGVPVTGGMASGSSYAGGNTLIINDHCYNAGAVGVGLSGDLSIDLIVSQGCRPVGHSLEITQGQYNAIMSIDDQPPLELVQELFAEFDEIDRQLMVKHGLYIGRAVNPDNGELGRGDFLVRGVVGIEQQTGALIIGDMIQPGERVQFHIRDANTATEDLDLLLVPQTFSTVPAGALLFSCNGRGTRLYPHPNGDIRTINDAFGVIPLGGFFAGGELGPVGTKNFLHGQAASLVLFRPRQ